MYFGNIFALFKEKNKYFIKITKSIYEFNRIN